MPKPRIKQSLTPEALGLAFSEALAIIDDAVIMINGNQDIVYFNHGAKQIFGYDPDEIIGSPVAALLPVESDARHRRHVEKFSQGPASSRHMGGRRSVRGRRQDGSEFPAEISVTKITGTDEPQFLAIVRDISGRASFEVVLGAMSETSSEMISIIGQDRTFVYVNPAFSRTLGYDRAELMDDFQVSKLVHPDDLSRLRGAEFGSSTEYRALTKSGNWVCLEGERYSISVVDKVQIVAVDRDVTGRKQAEKRARVEQKRQQVATDVLTKTLEQALDVGWNRKSDRFKPGNPRD